MASKKQEIYTWKNKALVAGGTLPLVYPGAKVLVFDTETTGVDTSKETKDRVVQFSAIMYKVDKNGQLEKEDWVDMYINPEVPMPASASKVNGITDEILEKAPVMNYVFDRIYKLLCDANVWVGHNIKFDIDMMIAEAKRCNHQLPKRSYIDTLTLGRYWFEYGKEVPNYKLSTLFSYLYPEVELQFHNSMEDVAATAKLLQFFLDDIAEDNIWDDTETSEGSHDRQLTLEKWNYYSSKQKNDRRLRIKIGEGAMGDIYYDLVRYCWSHKATDKARTLFQSLDLVDLEMQFLEKYSWYPTMDALAVGLSKWWIKTVFQKKTA